MSRFEDLIALIRQTKYGRDMRAAIAEGIEIAYEHGGGGSGDITITDLDEKTVIFTDPNGNYSVVKTSFLDTLATLILNEDAREAELLTTDDIPSIVQQVINQIPNAESEMF